MNKKKNIFWNNRSDLKKNYGTDDFMLKELEKAEITKIIRKNTHVLDVGCGDGSVLSHLSRKKNCTGIGIDFAEKIIFHAQKQYSSKRIKFIVYDMQKLSHDMGSFNYIISKRSLCNLDSAKEQKNVFLKIMSLLKKGGYYLMIEDFKEGLDKINSLRRMLNLYEIEMPWHNLFLNEKDVQKWEGNNFSLKEINQLSGTYYFLSRVVYAKLNEGKKLRYDSEINKISMKLPQSLTDACVTKLYVWKKTR